MGSNEEMVTAAKPEDKGPHRKKSKQKELQSQRQGLNASIYEQLMFLKETMFLLSEKLLLLNVKQWKTGLLTMISLAY